MIPGNPLLEGIWQGTAGGIAVVAPPHPLMGGHSSNPVVQAISSGVVAAGHRALLFNFRGVGESSGDPSGDLDDADEDFRAALACAAASGAPLVATGYSFGGATALRVASADTRVTAVLAVAPPPVLFDRTTLERFRGTLTVVAAERDDFAPAESLAEIVRSIPGARFEVVSGTDHFFGRGIERIVEITRGALFSI
jgi:alpha/beta superfamily hydrolase